MPSSLQKGIQAAKDGQMQEALDFMKDAIIEEPQNADVWVWIAAIIDDLDKQEIFLKKALEIDPDNIPAQRGLSYLYKRKRDEASVRGGHLSDHTRPISPFPVSQRSKGSDELSGWSKLDMSDLNEIADKENETKKEKFSGGFFHNLPPLNTFESIILVIVVIVFFFIGLIAASALFDFDLPLDFLSTKKPSLASEPPYPGVFLYEDGIYFDMQQHEGLPKQEEGIPSTYEEKPLIVFWQSTADPDKIQMVYQTGEVIPFTACQGKSNAELIQPLSTMNSGLYCFQQSSEVEKADTFHYWCFRVTELPSE
jgi:tetratricopeptide (TPR) repeat protein